MGVFQKWLSCMWFILKRVCGDLIFIYETESTRWVKQHVISNRHRRRPRFGTTVVVLYHGSTISEQPTQIKVNCPATWMVWVIRLLPFVSCNCRSKSDTSRYRILQWDVRNSHLIVHPDKRLRACEWIFPIFFFIQPNNLIGLRDWPKLSLTSWFAET